MMNIIKKYHKGFYFHCDTFCLESFSRKSDNHFRAIDLRNQKNDSFKGRPPNCHFFISSIISFLLSD